MIIQTMNIDINDVARAFRDGDYKREFWRGKIRIDHPEAQENWHNILSTYNYSRLEVDQEVDDSEDESESSNSVSHRSASDNAEESGS
jgi:hypothetical protein